MPEKIVAHYHITTPMFIGDANQNATHISPAAIKGALRFWWRALNWGRIRKHSKDDVVALKELYQQEGELFGSSADKGAGQSSFKIVVENKHYSQTEKYAVHKKFKQYAASRYLGYGLMEAFPRKQKKTDAGQLVRSCLNEGQYLVVKLMSCKSVDTSLIDAVIALGMLGALGSRARHGMGCLSLQSISKNNEEIWKSPSTKKEYLEKIEQLIDISLPYIPPFSAFSKSSRVDVLLSGKSPYEVLDGFGRGMLFYRSWGRSKEGKGDVLGEPSEERFKDDHDWKYGKRPPNFHPQRVVFGLPHNYGPKPKLSVTAENYDRRSSPLLFHVHKLKNEYLGVSILLHSDFLPTREKINAGGRNVTANIEWDLLHQFLDGTDGNGNLRFKNRERVL